MSFLDRLSSSGDSSQATTWGQSGAVLAEQAEKVVEAQATKTQTVQPVAYTAPTPVAPVVFGHGTLAQKEEIIKKPEELVQKPAPEIKKIPEVILEPQKITGSFVAPSPKPPFEEKKVVGAPTNASGGTPTTEKPAPAQETEQLVVERRLPQVYKTPGLNTVSHEIITTESTITFMKGALEKVLSSPDAIDFDSYTPFFTARKGDLDKFNTTLKTVSVPEEEKTAVLDLKNKIASLIKELDVMEEAVATKKGACLSLPQETDPLNKEANALIKEIDITTKKVDEQIKEATNEESFLIKKPVPNVGGLSEVGKPKIDRYGAEIKTATVTTETTPATGESVATPEPQTPPVVYGAPGTVASQPVEPKMEQSSSTVAGLTTNARLVQAENDMYKSKRAFDALIQGKTGGNAFPNAISFEVEKQKETLLSLQKNLADIKQELNASPQAPVEANAKITTLETSVHELANNFNSFETKAIEKTQADIAKTSDEFDALLASSPAPTQPAPIVAPKPIVQATPVQAVEVKQATTVAESPLVSQEKGEASTSVANLWGHLFSWNKNASLQEKAVALSRPIPGRASPSPVAKTPVTQTENKNFGFSSEEDKNLAMALISAN